MRQPFGSILQFNFIPVRPWLSLGPGWAALAGALSTGPFEFNQATLLQLLSLWLLVDPLLGILWAVAAEQRLWRSLAPEPNQLPAPARRGFFVPYAQPNSAAGQLALRWRRYGRWWHQSFWPEQGGYLAAFVVALGLTVLLSLSLNPTIFWLTLLALGLILLAGLTPTDPTRPEGGRLQAVVQLLLPWVMGITLWSTLTLPGLTLGICYWVTYLGGLRWLGQQPRASLLFWMGQFAAIWLLLALGLLSGAVLLGVLLAGQQIIKTQFPQATNLLPRLQPYLVLSILVAGWSLGG